MAKSDFDSSEIKEFYNSSAKKKNNNSILIRRSARIFHLRNFNNWTKSIFINKYLKILDVNNQDLRILDLCCGKGGDQLKWLQRNVSDLTFVDISSDSVRICQERYSKLTTRNSVYSARFFVADCCVDDLASMFKGDLYDLVSCQFALHYAFESISKARKMLQNISEVLKGGGYFIATIPNAYELVKRATKEYFSNERESSSNGITFGNAVYSVKFPLSSYSVSKMGEELQFPLFGAQYMFYLDGVVDCPEFLVYPPLLNELASEYGLIPVHHPISFAENFYETIAAKNQDQDPVELLKKMEALETLFADGLQDQFEYGHVKDQNNSKTVGTLSSSEWSVATLYCLVAYQKK